MASLHTCQVLRGTGVRGARRSTGWAYALAAQLHTWCNLLIGLVQEEN